MPAGLRLLVPVAARLVLVRPRSRVRLRMRVARPLLAPELAPLLWLWLLVRPRQLVLGSARVRTMAYLRMPVLVPAFAPDLALECSRARVLGPEAVLWLALALARVPDGEDEVSLGRGQCAQAVRAAGRESRVPRKVSCERVLRGRGCYWRQRGSCRR